MTDQPAQEAFELALRFAKVVSDEAVQFSMNQPTACGIGIAYESNTEFYPETEAT